MAIFMVNQLIENLFVSSAHVSLNTGVSKETSGVVNCGLTGLKLVTWIDVLSIPVSLELPQIRNTLFPHITPPIPVLI